MKGIVLAGGLGRRLGTLTKITNKHLLPVYDRPMIYFPIESLVDAGIKEIMIVTGGRNAGDFLRLLENGREFGLRHLDYTYQEGEGGIAEALGLCEDFADGSPVAVILGDNIFGNSLGKYVAEFRKDPKGARLLFAEMDNPQDFGVPRFHTERGVPRFEDGPPCTNKVQGQVVEIIEKPETPPSNYAVTGFYQYDAQVFEIIKTLRPSSRNELEITDVNNTYLRQGKLSWDVYNGWWIDAGSSPESHFAASTGNNNDGFIYGGTVIISPVNSTRNYAQNTDAWTNKADMPGANEKGQGANIGSYKCYAWGGSAGAVNYEYTAFDPQPSTALEDLKTFLDAQWPTAWEFLKTDVCSFAWALEDLKADVQATALDALEDLKTSLAAYGWSLTDLKTALDAYAQALEDLKCEIITSEFSFTDLRCELKTKDTSGPYVSGNPTPAPNQAGVAVNSNIVIVIKDNGWGVDINSVWVDVKDNHTGTTTRYKVGVAGFSYALSSDKRTCTVTIDPTADFEYNRNISVSVFASDLAGNPGLPQVV